MCKRVLVTLDGSHTSEEVLAEAKKLSPGAEVTLLMVGSQPKATSEAPRPPYTGGAPVPGGVVAMPPPRTVESRAQAYDRGRDEMTSYLESCAEPLRDAGFDVRLEVR
ncbi:MAG TPA: universal stress protein, partial [Dehalococcoidia bacterium]|nr:universal stress protein [Dehalococcoidia bacterium]